MARGRRRRFRSDRERRAAFRRMKGSRPPPRRIIILETPQRSGKKQLTETKTIVKHTGLEGGLKVKPPKPFDNVIPVEGEVKLKYEKIEQKTIPEETPQQKPLKSKVS